jgi:DNA polymerase
MTTCTTLHIDFETRSAADIKNGGLDVYASDPTTEMLCLGFAFDDEKPELILPHGGRASHAQLIKIFEHIDYGGRVVAHNAAFEIAIWNQVCVPRFKWPVLRTEQTHCTMAMAYAMSLPGSLDRASAAMGIPQQKDLVGSRIMLQLSQPRTISNDGSITWWEDEEKLERLYAYCLQDIEVERELYKRLIKLSEDERKVWLLDQTINQRGIGVDLDAVKAALKVVEAEKKRLDLAIRSITENRVLTCTATAQLTDWLNSRGVETDGVAKADVYALLTDPSIPSDCKSALMLRQEAAKSSTAKLNAMQNGVSRDGRLRGLFAYHGAATGRFASRRIQVQNFPRPDLEQEAIDNVFHILKAYPTDVATQSIELLYGAPMKVLSDCLRGFLIAAPGHALIASDFSNIEGRVLAWLADETWKVAAFKEFDDGTGPDLYKMMASLIYGVEVKQVSKDERLIGKVAELACGYGGGVGAFQAMAKAFQLKIPDTTADSIKKRWRESNKNIVRYWYALEAAAMQAVLNPRVTFKVSEGLKAIKFKTSGSFLWCRLPSGRVICYPYPKIESLEMPWGDMKECLTYMSVNSLTNKWERGKTYGGSLCENVCQAVARDLLVDAMIRLENLGFPVVMHVHDEIVCEVLSANANVTRMEEIMTAVPAWATGLPISAEGWAATRYRK